MKLHRITIANFRSFKGEQTFHFPEAPGLYFMQGVNQTEPRLEANGAGKTTIWDALTWLLFAKTCRGLKAGDVCNWEAGKGTRVELAFEIEDAESLQVMTRTWKPNAWTLQDLFGKVTDLTKDEANDVLATIRLDFTPFLNCILMAQGQPMFLDQKHDVKAALFSDVMGLDRWLEYSAKASKRASAQDSISRGYERDLAGFKSTLAQIQGQDLTTTMKHWEREHSRKLDALEGEYQPLLADVKKYRLQIVDLSGALEGHRINHQEANEELLEAKRVLAVLDEENRKLRFEWSDSKAYYNLNLELSLKIRAGKCPTCGQKTHHEHTDQLGPNLEKQLHQVAANLKTWKKAEEAYEKARSKVEALTKEVTELYEVWNSTDQRGRNLGRVLQMTERELDRIEDRVEELVKEKNPYAELHSLQREAGEDAARAIARTQRLLDDSNSRYSLFSFWVRGFKDLRLQLIAEALNELEIEVNSCVASLGLVDWELNFQVDRETKGGNIQRGFNVFVKSPHNENPVPWEAWSGGEAQRLRIAATMGLANLIRSRTGTELELEVWDEPSTGLSKQGINDLLESLAARARHEGRQVWVVDHTAHSFGGFAGGAIITKTRAGSTVEQY